MIESGSLSPGVTAGNFGLPAGTALRYERPAEALRPLLPSYAVLDSDTTIWQGPGSWALPGWAQIWIVLTDGPITVRIRNRDYAPLGSAVIYGGTSRAMPVTSRGGVTVVVDVSPMGWARLIDAPAEQCRDRIQPLDQFLPADWTDELVARMHGSDRAGEVKGLLDDFFLTRLPPPHRDEAAIARINARLLSQASMESRAAAADLGLHPRTLLRLCARHFAYGPKMLMRRTRFLRILTDMMMKNEMPDSHVPPPGYHDVPHFLRDGKQFLGITPRQFLAMPMPYLRAVLRARTLVLGAPVPLLDRNLEAPALRPIAA